MEFTQEQKLYAEIVQKAWEDVEFKNELINNPVQEIRNVKEKRKNIYSK